MMSEPASRMVPPAEIRSVDDDTLLVFVSDTHIGGDPGVDIFESETELSALLDDLAGHDGPLELVLAGDFFDCLQIGAVPAGRDRASLTIARPEYAAVFDALRRVRTGMGHRVIYLPGNHDAEVWWNQEIQRTLTDAGLVDEFALSYAARFATVPARLIYCEHGNQFDPANIIRDYDDPLDTPLGDHIVTDVTRRIAPVGRISRNIDLGDISRVYPLTTVPDWIAGRIFYDLLERMAVWLILPLVIGYSAYRLVAYGLASTGDEPTTLWESSGMLSGVQRLFTEIAWDSLLLVTVLVLFFVASRRAAVQTVSTLTSRIPGDPADALGLGSPVEHIRRMLASDTPPPMHRGMAGRGIGVFVSGHTHAPALTRVGRDAAEDAVMVNTGCWLRQMWPVRAHFGGPPVFVSRFVQTHVRVFLRQGTVHVELWEHPRPARSHQRPSEHLAILGRVPEQPAAGSAPRVMASERLS
jgi:UDP-2,3-diacylglucosamine pyrophosphatase LpxH